MAMENVSISIKPVKVMIAAVRTAMKITVVSIYFFAVFQEMVEGRSEDAFILIFNAELSHSICESSSRHADYKYS